MTCPDDLLIGARQGRLTEEDRRRLDAHLERCPTCRLSLRAGLDFDGAASTEAGDELIAARIASLAIGERSKRERTFGFRRFAYVAAALVATLALGGVAAASLGAWPFAREEAAPHTAPPLPIEEERTLPTADEPHAEVEVIAPPSEPVVVPEPPRIPSARELFADANAARREGEPQRARTLYRELLRHHPRSREAAIASVSLGRVLLDLSEPAEALAQFDRYLARESRGALVEEALFGRASALARLGRHAEERRTWERLLAEFPGSIYADRARVELQSAP